MILLGVVILEGLFLLNNMALMRREAEGMKRLEKEIVRNKEEMKQLFTKAINVEGNKIQMIDNLPIYSCNNPKFYEKFESYEDGIKIRRKWSEHLSFETDEFYAGACKSKNEFCNMGKFDPGSDYGYERFDMLGPVVPKCKNLQSFGEGDNEKWVCDLNKEDPNCLIISFGSNNQFQFEDSVIKNTMCKIEVFDCFNLNGIPDRLKGRVRGHNYCIGEKDEGKFMTWKSIIKYLNLTQSPSYIKMDIEGFEYDVMRSIIDSRELMPQQISMEIHYNTVHVPKWPKERYKSGAELGLFMDFLFKEGGYMLVEKRKNFLCGYCAEVLLAKFLCSDIELKNFSFNQF